VAAPLGLAARIRRHVLDVDLRLPLAGVTVLFGPSGAGKTTLLRCLAGLDHPDAGRIEVAGEVWDDGRHHLPARRRRVGYLFQDHALFPHLGVAGNVGYGLGQLPRRERPARVSAALATAGAAHLAGRPVRGLSGGEAQRVALARALAPEPRLLLLDEPLSALDSPTRARLRTELRRVLVRAGVPSIVVTHDRAEALALGDRMAVLAGGRVHQVDDLATVFGRPASPVVADAVGVESTLPGEVVEVAGGLARVRVGPHLITAGGDLGGGAAGRGGELGPGAITRRRPGDRVLVCVRAEDVALALPGDRPSASPRNLLPGTVSALTPGGPLLRVDLDCAGVPLVAYVTGAAGEDLRLAPGTTVTAVVKTTAVHLVAR
jgi:molybdate transport system ATP-binding protein